MQPRPGLTPDSDDLVPGQAENDQTPLPGSLERAARVSSLTPPVNVPAEWLDGLLSIGRDLPFEQGEEGVVRALVAALEHLVPGVQVGIRLPSPGSSTVAALKQPHVLWTEPPISDDRVRSVRVFPEAAHERTVALPRIGGALHFASEDDALESGESPHVQLMDRAALVVAQSLGRLRAEERAAALEAEVHAAEAQMVQAEKLASLGQIAAGMVHELNNPLTSIAAYTDFLLRRFATREGADADDVERLRRIAESANRMLRFTRDIVSYARPSGDVPIALHLNTVIERALAFCEHEIVGAGVVVERAFNNDIGLVRGLPEQLAQVFVNLITNACHAMARPRDSVEAPSPHSSQVGLSPLRRRPVLTVSTARLAGEPTDAARVAVVVQDTGCGISPQNLTLIFNPFFTTKRAGSGTGLGLSIVKNIVEGHGGQIRAESDPSVGTRFILTFPVESGSVEPHGS
jgi:signal transduction histidine kinase